MDEASVAVARWRSSAPVNERRRPQTPPTESKNSRWILPKIHSCVVKGDMEGVLACLSEHEGLINARDACGRTPLMYSILANRPKFTSVLLKAGAAIDKADNDGRTALHWAANKDTYRCLKKLLVGGASLVEQDGTGATPLHISAAQKSSKCLRLLLKHWEHDIDFWDLNKRTALHLAACTGFVENVKLLVKHKSNNNIPDREGRTPVHWAALSKSPDAAACLRTLLRHFPSAVNWQDFQGKTPLHLAVVDNSILVVKEIISSEECDLNLLDNDLRVPLHLAAYYGRQDVVALLMSKGANCSAPDAQKARPLHLAVLSDSTPTVTEFLTKPSLIEQRDGAGCTPLMWAARKSADEIVGLFLDRGADIQAVDQLSATALHTAAFSGHVSTLCLLLEKGADINAQDNLGRPALFYSCVMGHEAALHSLLREGSSLEHIDREGRNALHWAAFGGHATVCEALINLGLHPDGIDAFGRTPMMYAAFGGRVNCISLLVTNGANHNCCDNMGFNVLHWASKQGHLETIRYLLSYVTDLNQLTNGERRYTALDLAILEDHHELTHFLIEQGAYSVAFVRNQAATKIQATFKGYRVRKLLWQHKYDDNFDLLSAFEAKSSAPKEKLDYDAGSQCTAGQPANPSFSDPDLTPEKRESAEDSFRSSENEPDLSSSSSSHGSEDETGACQFKFGDSSARTLSMNRKIVTKGQRYTPTRAASHRERTPKSTRSDSGVVKGRMSASISCLSLSNLLDVQACSWLQLNPEFVPKRQLFKRFKKKSGRKKLQKTPKRLRIFSSTAAPRVPAVNCRELQDHGEVRGLRPRSTSLSTLSENSAFLIPNWCEDPVLKKAAAEEWINSVRNIVFERVPATYNLLGSYHRVDVQHTESTITYESSTSGFH